MSKVALVTGGSGGIGRAICLQLAKDGFDVCVHYNSNRDSAEDVCRAVEETGQRAVALCGDLGDSAVCAAIMLGCVDALGGLDALVNNAGLTCDGLLMRMTDEQYHKVLRANLDSAFFMTREAVNHMAREKRGKIVNITSVVGLTGNAGQANYAASKAGLVGLTKSAAKELAGRGVTVNAVAPGFIETDMTTALPEGVRAQYLDHIPLKAVGTAQHVADAVAFLGSDKAAYITGQVLAVNGGMYC